MSGFNWLGATVTSAMLALTPGAGMASVFSIDLTFEGGTDEQIEAMTTAAAIWETLITGYEVESYDSDLSISVTLEEIDGSGSVLGYASPTEVNTDGQTYAYTDSGVIGFDTDDIDDYSFSGLVELFLHEMAHVIGFGTLWDLDVGPNTIYDLTDADSGGTGTEYTGEAAVAAYNEVMGTSVDSIALELAGGDGTAGAHWDEYDYGVGVGYDDMAYELMTGWLNSGSESYISAFTLASFEDLGYTTLWSEGDYDGMTVEDLIALVSADIDLTTVAAVPLPNGLFLGLTALGSLIGLGRRRWA